MAPRHFLDLDRLDASTLRQLLERGRAFKAQKTDSGDPKPLAGKVMAMLFDKPSTRTRVSFEVGMKQLGGEVVMLSAQDTQLKRGETVADTARVLSRYVDAIVMRTTQRLKLQEMADYASVPVINALTDDSHPCQLMADVMTFEEKRGPIKGRVVAWSGDGNNVAASWVHAAVKFGFELRLACPKELAPHPALLDWARQNGGKVSLTHDPKAAVKGADCVVTDAWLSMGDEKKGAANRHNLLAHFRVDERLMQCAKPDALFMHCLPAHRGEEVTDGVIDGPNSVVWDEAENRLHVQKSILAWCME
ncbi:MAG: ornithine carbamoyltransferase [Rhodospirillales bacterium]